MKHISASAVSHPVLRSAVGCTVLTGALSVQMCGASVTHLEARRVQDLPATLWNTPPPRRPGPRQQSERWRAFRARHLRSPQLVWAGWVSPDFCERCELQPQPRPLCSAPRRQRLARRMTSGWWNWRQRSLSRWEWRHACWWRKSDRWWMTGKCCTAEAWILGQSKMTSEMYRHWLSFLSVKTNKETEKWRKWFLTSYNPPSNIMEEKKRTRTKFYLRQAANQRGKQTSDLISTNGYVMHCKRMCIKCLHLM